jgi:hypothetical protein
MAYYSSAAGNQVAGLRFVNVTIPKNATITQAYIQFTASKYNYATPALTIRGENSGNSAAFTLVSGNISGRSKTTASVPWNPLPWTILNESGPAEKTADLTTLVQEIVNRSDWAPGNSMTFFISGTGTRTAFSYENTPAKAALLYIGYSY